MSIDAHGNIHRSPGSPGAGQFDGHARSAPDDVLSQDAGSFNPSLDSGLQKLMDQWEVDPDALPGIDDAWQSLNDRAGATLPESLEDVLEDGLHLQIDDDEEITFASVIGREDSGAVTIYVETDMDSRGRGTEVTVPPGPGAERALAARGSKDAFHEREASRTYRNLLLKGHIPPWHLFGDRIGSEQKYSRLHSARSQADRTEQSLLRTQDAHEEYVQALTDGTELDPAWMERERGGNGYTLRIEWEEENGLFGHLAHRDVTARYVNDVATTYRRAKDRAAHAEALMSEAESLPDGALKDFLIAERPEQSYRTTEGKGRGKRQIVKTYRPTSELQQEVGSARDRLPRAERDRQQLLDVLERYRTESLEPRREEARRHREACARAEREFLEYGWPASSGDAPPLPTDW